MTDYALSLHNIEVPGSAVWHSDNLVKVSYALNINDVTELTVAIPASVSFASGIIGRNTTAKLWRRPRGARTYYIEGDTEWLLTKYERTLTTQDDEAFLTFAHPNVLLQRRLIAYKQETLYADKTIKNSNDGQTWQMMLAYIDENLGGLCQDVSRIVPNFTTVIETDSSNDLRESSAPWRNLLTTLQELSGYKEDGAVRYFFDMRLLDGVPTFRMRPNYLGTDVSDLVTFGRDFGNLDEIKISEDYGREINVCYAGGAGSGLTQYVEMVYDTLPVPLLRSENFESMGDIDVATVLHDHGLRYLARNRAKRLLRAKIKDTGSFLYGSSYRHGDLVTLAVGDQAYKCHIYAVSVTADETGETVDIYLDAEQPL